MGIIYYLLLFAGMILYLAGAIGLLIAEFKEHILWGLFGLFTQIGNVIFAIIHFDKCKKYLGWMLLGILMFVWGFVQLAMRNAQY